MVQYIDFIAKYEWRFICIYKDDRWDLRYIGQCAENKKRRQKKALISDNSPAGNHCI